MDEAQTLRALDQDDNREASREQELQAELDRISEELGRLYRERDPILAALAEARGPAVLPRPRYQTDKQRAISRCPRCGGKLMVVSLPEGDVQ